MIAITHLPSPNLDAGQRTHIQRTPIDYARAVQQHRNYCALLHRCGADVVVLDVNRDLPDAVFVEDTAIVLDEVAVMTSMGTAARRGELAGIARALGKYRNLEWVELPALLEGGDVLVVGRTLLVGLSARTDRAGTLALQAIVGRYGYHVRGVPVRGCLHLKTACTALPDQRLLVQPAWLETDGLRDFEQVHVPPEEPWGANVLLLSDRVCLAEEYVRTARLLQRRGYRIQTTDISEFARAEGGMTCLSLLVGR